MLTIIVTVYRSCPCLEVISPLQVTHLPPMWDILLPLTKTPDRRDQRVLMYLPKDTGDVRGTKLSKFQNLVFVRYSQETFDLSGNVHQLHLREATQYITMPQRMLTPCRS